MPGGAFLLAILAFAGCAHPVAQFNTQPNIGIDEYRIEPQSKKAIVFVHGVFGDIEGTWRNEAAGTSFPELIARDSTFRGFDIYLVGYLSPKWGRAKTLQEVSTSVYRRLTDRDIFNRHDTVVFIAHSMGGLVVERILSRLNTEDKDALHKVRAALFFATPANGAPIAELGSWVSRNPQLRDMDPVNLNSWLQSVSDDIVIMRRQREQTAAWFPRMYAAYETEPTWGAAVVPRVYATMPVDDPMEPLTADHLTIVKPTDLHDEIMDWTRGRIRDALNSVPAHQMTSTRPVLRAATFIFHQTGDNKDHDTHFKASVSDKHGFIASVTDYRDIEFHDPGDANVDATILIPNLQKGDIANPVFGLQVVSRKGNDRWKYSVTVQFTWSDGTTEEWHSDPVDNNDFSIHAAPLHR